MKRGPLGEARKLNDPPQIVLRLYVAGQSPNSSRALSNIREYCRLYLSGRHSLEVVDVYQSPETALEDGILLTPSLVVRSASPPRRLVGNLSRLEALSELLGLE